MQSDKMQKGFQEEIKQQRGLQLKAQEGIQTKKKWGLDGA